MSDQKDSVPYSPEPGSSLRDIQRTEELGRIEDEETAEKRKLEKLDEDYYKEEEFRGLRMDWTHTDRVREGKIAGEYAKKSSNEIENEAYRHWWQAYSKGDNRPTAEVYSEFYGKVYPQYEAYREARLQKEPEAKL